jgi:biotin transporter BioY
MGRFLITTLILSWSAGKCWQIEQGKTSGLLFTYWLHKLNVFLLLLNHGLEVNINLNAESLIVSFTLATLFFDVVHSSTTVFSIDFQLFYLV